MIADTYLKKALSNFKSAKIIFTYAKGDEEQLNMIAYHLQQTIELAIKHILCLNGIPFQKTHDLDQLITTAKQNKVELYLPEYIKEKADIISLWESKTRYVMGFYVDLERISKTIVEVENYLIKLKSVDVL